MLDRCNPPRACPDWFSGIVPAARRGGGKAARLCAAAVQRQTFANRGPLATGQNERNALLVHMRPSRLWGENKAGKSIATLIIPLSQCSTRSAAQTNGRQTPQV
jgi:hypothetical protein